jgi:Divergent InlB B-repeat domain
MAPWLAVGVALIIVLSGGVAFSSTSSSAAGSNGAASLLSTETHAILPATYTTLPTTLTVNRSSVNLSSQFWGTTVNNEVRMFRGETNAVNATPARVLVWPGAMAGEDYDPFTETHYETDYGTPSPALTNESQFIEMCRAIHCTAIMQVPAEIDNPSFAEAIVNYTEVNLSFTPAYWMIGNEPELWEHWKVPWKDWESDYTNGPDPTQFGDEVVQYVKAIRAVDNTTPILGLPASGCTCGYYTFNQWIAGVLAVTGSKIQAVAFHEYPAGWLGTGNGSLQAFYGTIQGAASIPTRIVAAREAVQATCPGCNVSVFISELGSALSWSAYGQYAIGFSGDLSLASQITQAMDVNLTNIDLFATELATTNSWFGTNGSARPDYALYTSIFDHLGTQSFSVNTTGLGRSVYAIDTIAPNDQGRRDLLVVNDNISHSVSFTPAFAELSGDAPVEAWSWNGSIHYTRSNATGWVEPYTPTPIPHAYPNGLPSNYTLPPQSLILFETYPAGASYVQVLNSGVPSPTAWYASVGQQFYTTTASNISLLLPAGSYPIGSVPIPLPIGGKELTPVEQLAPVPASPAEVHGAYTNITIPFVDQWWVNVTASPGDGGTARPDVGWWDAGTPLTVTAAPASGYAFEGWSGWGPGSYNGSNRSATIVPEGRIVEKARFAVGEQVDLLEQGLPPDTLWSITVRGFTYNSTSNLITVYELLGSYGYTVSPIPGYRSVPENGGFQVTSSLQLVSIQFVPLTPAPPAYAVTFRLVGLPASTAVAITIREDTETTGGPDEAPATFQLLNGSYAYRVGYVGGYHADVAEKLFLVRGGPLTVTVPFVPTVYPAAWVASGTRAGMNWTVVSDNETLVSTSAWLATPLANGSYPYLIELPANFTVSPRTGVMVVDGFAPRVYLVFTVVEFPAMFEASGPGASTYWSVRLGNMTQLARAGGSAFMAANGTYTYDVHAPAGYYPVPSHGVLTVAGPAPAVVIQFYPTSEQPSAALVASLTAGAVSTAFWIGVSIAVGFVAFRTLGRRTR